MRDQDRFILSNRLYLPERLVPQSVRRALTYKFVEYENVEELNDDGEPEIVTHRKTVVVENFKVSTQVNPRGTIGLHCGRLAALRELLPSDITWEDCRANVPMGFNLKLTSKPRYNQSDCLASFRQSDGGGLVNAPTSWGKTFFGVYAALALDQRTLVLAARTNWCENWLKEFYRHTNAGEIEKRTGRKLAGILDSSDLRKVEVYPCFNVATPAAFYSKAGKKLRKHLRRAFGLVVFDEVVMLPAEETSAVFTSFAPLWRLGLSADERRKDEKHKLSYDYCGPVVAQGKFTGRTKTGTFSVVDTGTQIDSRYVFGVHWYGSLCNQLARRKARNSTIVSSVLDDIISGYKVLILVDRREQAMQLYRTLKSEYIPTAESTTTKKRGSTTRRVVAEILMGGDNRQLMKIEAAGQRRYDVLIATDKSVGMNTDMPGLDCVHDASPTTNEQLIKQRKGRVARDYRKCLGPDCTYHTSNEEAVLCPECGGTEFRDAKRWPIKYVLYKDEGSPRESMIGRFLDNSFATKVRYLQSEGFTCEQDVSADTPTKPDKSAVPSFIKRRN